MCLSAKLPTTKHNHTWARNYRTPAPRGAGSIPGERGRRLPLQMPFRAAGLAPKLHSSPLVWSQGCDRLQSSFSCLAQTLQQPQPSGTSPTPGAHCGGAAGHWHTAGQGEPRACGAERPVSAGSRAEPPDPPPLPPSLLSRTAGRPAALTRRARQRRAAARAGRVPAEPMSSAGAAGARASRKRERGRRGLKQRRAPPPYIGRGAAACAAALTSRVPGRGRVQRSRHPRNAAGARRGRPAPPRLPLAAAGAAAGGPGPAGPRAGRGGLSALRGVRAPLSSHTARPAGALRTRGFAGAASRAAAGELPGPP